ncbi:hypothetical protein GGS21DRAFT_279769 [Xylaria nigripes]|nr:hypothetical protein GGS21DRAFT_279769 [Xylaria nigripes]
MSPPLNLPFLIGNDICRLARVRRILQGRLSRQFVHRILTPEEIQQSATATILRCILDQKVSDSHSVQVPTRKTEEVEAGPAFSAGEVRFTRAVEFMAGRFAAKEAVIKAHPYRRLTFRSIAILRMGFGSGVSPGASLLDMSERMRTDMMGREEQRETQPPKDDTSMPRSSPLVAFIKADGVHPDMHASVSISHDTEYATAVCLGLSPAFSRIPSMEAKPVE